MIPVQTFRALMVMVWPYSNLPHPKFYQSQYISNEYQWAWAVYFIGIDIVDTFFSLLECFVGKINAFDSDVNEQLSEIV